MKDLTNEVKDVITTLHDKTSDMAASIKVLIMAINVLQKCGALE